MADINDLLYDKLGTLGFVGALPDRAYNHLGSLGYTGAMNDRLSLAGGLRVYVEGLLGVESLSLPYVSDITLLRNEVTYSIDKAASDYFTTFTGSTIYVSNAGNDTTGNGAMGNEYATVDKAILESSSNDIISLSVGTYAYPSLAITSNLAFIRTEASGLVLFGEFVDMSAATVGVFQAGFTTTLADSGHKVVGFIRADKLLGLYGGVYGATKENYTDSVNIALDGFPSIYAAASDTTYYQMGDSADMSTLIANGEMPMWTAANTGAFTISSGTTFIGQDLILTGFGTILADSATSTLVLDRCHAYSGANANIDILGKFRAFGLTVAGSSNNSIDYGGNAEAAEIDCLSVNSQANASTTHDSANVLRVGGTYYNAPRTIHDISSGYSLNFSVTIGSGAYAPSAILLQNGNDANGTQMAYGDVDFVGTYATTILDNNTTTPIKQIELDTPWPY